MLSRSSFNALRCAWQPLLACAALALSAGAAMANGYLQTNIVSDGSVPLTITDKNLSNPWGIAFSPTSPFWIADNNDGLSTLYNGVGEPLSLVVTVPPPAGASGPSAPDGIIYNPTSDFVVTGSGGSGPAAFLFSTENGTISGWNPKADLHNAILVVDQSSYGTVFKGIAWAHQGKVNWLYATDFHHNQVDVFDANFNMIGAFTDPSVPKAYAPFGIQNIGNFLVVTFAKQDAAKHDDVPGGGFGYVDIFTPAGKMVRRFFSGGALNAPWGIAQAPANFGEFSGDILIANFGDGKIHAFDPVSGENMGPLKNASGDQIVIDGLWGIAFGNGASAGLQNVLYFTAGPNDEANGLFGQIQALP